MDVTGDNIERLTDNPASDTSPVWSPDGKKIAFVSNRDGNSEIYVMNSNGSNQVNLSENPASDKNPTWSPDGKRIAFTSNRDGNSEIYVMNFDGTNQVNLTNDPYNDSDPAWCCPVFCEKFPSSKDNLMLIPVTIVLVTLFLAITFLNHRKNSPRWHIWSDTMSR